MYLLYWHKLVSCKSLVVGLSCWLLVGEVAIASPPNQCEGLLPDAIGEPRARSWPYPGGGQFLYCDRPTSSRSGILAFGYGWTEGLPGDIYSFYDSRDESQVGGFSTNWLNGGFYPPTDTFQLTRQRRPPGWREVVPDPTVESVTDHGQLIAEYQLDLELRDSISSTYRTAPDLIEGGVFLVYLRIRDGQGWQLEAWRFDKLARILFGPYVVIAGAESSPSVYFAAGVDVNRGQPSSLSNQRFRSGECGLVRQRRASGLDTRFSNRRFQHLSPRGNGTSRWLVCDASRLGFDPRSGAG